MSDDVRLDLLKDAIAESGLDGQTKTNALPDDPSVRAMSSGGIYRFGMAGSAAPTNTWSFDIFDARVQTKWLPDSELERIYRNGAEEIGRRPVPQWR